MKLTDTEKNYALKWAEAFGTLSDKASGVGLLSQLAAPVFSFVYDGKASADLIPGWEQESSVAEKEGRTERTLTYTDPKTGLQVTIESVVFDGFPAVEWVMRLKNTGTADTPIIEDIQPLDAVLDCPGGDPILHYANGSICSMDEYGPVTRKLNTGTKARITAGGGRSSSDFLPFFNVESKSGEGMIVGIGWTGEWAAEFQRDQEQGLRVRSGMALTHLKLHPGEEIRTPRILVLFWQSERVRGQNLLRRYILAHHHPTVSGKPYEMGIYNPTWGGIPASQHLKHVQAIIDHDLPIKYYWIDAEWMAGEGRWHTNTGNWNVNRERYPQGFKPISDLLHSSGLKLLVWFEPTRVSPGTEWYLEHREWCLAIPKEKQRHNWGTSQAEPDWVRWESERNQINDGDLLFNLGIPEAREFLTDCISQKVEEFGLDCYRQDGNIAPLEFWKAADTPDRQGMTEIRWVEGFYAHWDALHERHPDLLIENVGSGSRWMDLETIGRAPTHCTTDFPADPTGNQCHTYGLLSWIPLNAGGYVDLAKDSLYQLRSAMCTGLVGGLWGNTIHPQENPVPDDYPFDDVKRRMEGFLRIQKYFLGDYYPLTEYSQAEDAWMAYQLDLHDEGEGIVVVLKRPKSSLTLGIFSMYGIDADADYEVCNLDTGSVENMTGADLSERGLPVVLVDKPDSVIVRYKQKK